MQLNFPLKLIFFFFLLLSDPWLHFKHVLWICSDRVHSSVSRWMTLSCVRKGVTANMCNMYICMCTMMADIFTHSNPHSENAVQDFHTYLLILWRNLVKIVSALRFFTFSFFHWWMFPLLPLPFSSMDSVNKLRPSLLNKWAFKLQQTGLACMGDCQSPLPSTSSKKQTQQGGAALHCPLCYIHSRKVTWSNTNVF